MECTICERKFNSLSSFYRHNWSDKHLLMCQIKEYEREIKVLERKLAQYPNISDIESQIMQIPRLEKCVTYA